jgi:hypothetical protein
MKVPINEVDVIDLDAPVLPAFEKIVGKTVSLLVWCKHCREWHEHGPAEGHREAHCNDSASPYLKQGYNLAYTGKWSGQSPAE